MANRVKGKNRNGVFKVVHIRLVGMPYRRFLVFRDLKLGLGCRSYHNLLCYLMDFYKAAHLDNQESYARFSCWRDIFKEYEAQAAAAHERGDLKQYHPPKLRGQRADPRAHIKAYGHSEADFQARLLERIKRPNP